MLREIDINREIHSTLNEVIKWIRKHLNPDDVFTDDQLYMWALENGYIEEDL